LLTVVIERLRLWPLALRTRDAADIPPRVLSRIDACWTAATGLAFVDPATAAALLARGTRLAVAAGEPVRLGRWLSLHAIQIGMPGRRAGRQAQAVLARARRVVADDPASLGMLRWAEGHCAHSMGQWRTALAACDEAVDHLQRQARGAWWEITGAQIVGESSLYWLGRLPELEERVERAVVGAQLRNDLFGAVTRRIGGLSAIGRLAADDPDRAAREVYDALARWTGRGMDLQHWYAMQAMVQIELYRGESMRLWRYVDAQWPALERSRIHHLQVMRATSHWRRGLAALGAAYEDPRLLKVVAQSIRRLSRERMPWCDALAAMLAGGRARLLGDERGAAAHLRCAIETCEATEMELLAAVSRRRLGTLLGGKDGSALLETADAALRARGVRRADLFCAPFLPWNA
jgi:hypothetical protein